MPTGRRLLPYRGARRGRSAQMILLLSRLAGDAAASRFVARAKTKIPRCLLLRPCSGSRPRLFASAGSRRWCAICCAHLPISHPASFRVRMAERARPRRPTGLKAARASWHRDRRRHPPSLRHPASNRDAAVDAQAFPCPPNCRSPERHRDRFCRAFVAARLRGADTRRRSAAASASSPCWNARSPCD